MGAVGFSDMLAFDMLSQRCFTDPIKPLHVFNSPTHKKLWKIEYLFCLFKGLIFTLKSALSEFSNVKDVDFKAHICALLSLA